MVQGHQDQIATGIAKRITEAVDARMPFAEDLFAKLRTLTSRGGSILRPSYGPGEQIAHDLIRDVSVSLGLDVDTDAAGNLYASMPGPTEGAPQWISGSHLDAVPDGGNYDGAAGVIAGLSAVAALKDIAFQPARRITVMAIRAEECSSWFTGHHGGHFGSRAALGLLKEDELGTATHVRTGQTLREVMEKAGFDPDRVVRGPAYLSRANVRGFVELHIEQGPVLQHDHFPVGVVTSIRGVLRAREASCIGEYSHSGAVPQELRRDAVTATAELIREVEEAAHQIRDRGGDIVFTVGKFHTDAKVDSLSKVPGETRFTIDIRSQDLAVLRSMDELLDELSEQIGNRRNVCLELGRRTVSPPVAMDECCQSYLRRGARALHIQHRDIACGAGHDAADFARAGIPSCMIFVRNTGESHNPSEHMEMGDFREGVKLLSWFLATAE